MADEQVIGQVWNWLGSWAAKVDGKTYRGTDSVSRPSQEIGVGLVQGNVDLKALQVQVFGLSCEGLVIIEVAGHGVLAAEPSKLHNCVGFEQGS